jgi:hypothetical protein
VTGKLPQDLEDQRFPYSAVEPALAKTLGYAPGRMLALRARLRYLQRFLGPKSGKGARISYTEEDIWRLLIALRTQEHGVDPRIAAGLVRDHWKTIASVARMAADWRSEFNPVFLAMLLRVASGADDAERVSWIGGFERFNYSKTLKDAQGFPVRTENVDLYLNLMELGEDGEGDERGALCLHNLTSLIKRLRRHLGYEPSLAAKEKEAAVSAELAKFDERLRRHGYHQGASARPDNAPTTDDPDLDAQR